MTDFETMKEIYERAGIPFDVDPWYMDTPTIRLEAMSNEAIKGYAGFATDFRFDDEGSFIGMDIYE